MQNDDKKRQRAALLITGGVLLALLIAFGVYTILQQRKEIQGIRAVTQLEKEMLEEDYNELALQYEGYRFEISDASLAQKLATEQAKVQRLMEELRTVKSSNAARVAELRRELETLRKVLRSYVAQIDSLNRANQELRTENQEVKRQITVVTSERQQLKQEKERLTEQVTLAAKLSTSGFSARGLNARGKTTKRLSSMKQLQFDFTLDANVTAETGYKDIYLRLSNPQDQLLQQPSTSGTFAFEGGHVPYSAVRQVEYGGSAMPITMYWDIQEYLMEGIYRVELFAEGYLIGRYTFTL